MKWLEIIELRTTGNRFSDLESHLKKIVNEINSNEKKQAITFYYRERVETDFSFHLIHTSKKVENAGSTLGLRIAATLKEFGLVNHDIWVKPELDINPKIKENKNEN